MRIEHSGERLALVEEHILPLAHISEVIIVHEDYLHRTLVFHYRTKFLDIHLESTITCKHAHCAVGGSEGGSHCCRQSESHCSESTTSYYRALLVVFEIAA